MNIDDAINIAYPLRAEKEKSNATNLRNTNDDSHNSCSTDVIASEQVEEDEMFIGSYHRRDGVK